ncbi:MAG: hypothetical protein HW412_1396 [Bacteroidetes bacterium]|nr:hypothetical protein [Bacteroidota bacterium]
MRTRTRQFISLILLLVLLVCGLPIDDLFGQTPFFNYRKYLIGPPLTLSLHVDSVNTTSGYVKINGVDMGTLTGPFTWIWGDGIVNNEWFPHSHTYTDMTRNYCVQVISHYTSGGHDTADAVVHFVSPPISPISLDTVIAVHVPDNLITLGTRLYPPPLQLVAFADTFFRHIPRSTLEYILSVAATEEMDFANDNVYLFNDKFEEYMFRDPSFGGAYSLWFTDPVSFGVGDAFMQGGIGYSSLFHEMGHNFTLNTPASYYYGGRIDGNANAIFSESMAQIFAHAAGYEVVNGYLAYGLTEDVMVEIKQQVVQTIKFVRSSYENYLNEGSPYASWNDPTIPDDDTFGTFMTIAFKFCEHAENAGLGYRQPLKRMMTLLQGFNADWAGRYDQANNTAEADTFRATLLVTAVSYAFSIDLRDEFRLLNFPISDQIYDELYNSPVPIQLAWFTGQANPNGGGVLLEWMTLSEVNNFGFEIQRRREQAGEFQSLPGVFLPGHGTTNEPQYYSHADMTVVPGTWQYRLKQIDLDGTIHLSDAIVVVVPSDSVGGPIVFRLVESDGQQWPLEVLRDTSWHRYNIPLSAFGGGGGFLNTPVTKLVVVPIGGGGLIGGPITEVADWIDDVVVADSLIDNFDDGDYSDWFLDAALNGSYLRRSADSLTPNSSLRCMKLAHGNTMSQTFSGWVEKRFTGLTLSPNDTLRFWLRGMSYLITDVPAVPSGMPRAFALHQNYPNPFNPSTQVTFEIPIITHVELAVFDVLGRRVATLVDEMRRPGEYTVAWKAADQASGVYFVRLKAAGRVDTKRMLLLK